MSELTGSQYFTEQRTMHECPQCGKHGLVQTTNTKFECIWCDFHRDLNAKAKKTNINFLLPVIAALGLVGLGWLAIFPVLSGIFSSESKPTAAPDATPNSNIQVVPEQTPKASVTEEHALENSLPTRYPQAACGYDMNQVEKGVKTVELYPIFVDYSPAILEKIKTEYCQDAFKNNQNNLIQVASFRSRDQANEFRALMETTFGDAQVGAARKVVVR